MYLISKGANTNSLNKLGMSPLMIAISKLNYNLVKLIHKNGASIDNVDSKGRTPIFYLYKSIHWPKEKINMLKNSVSRFSTEELQSQKTRRMMILSYLKSQGASTKVVDKSGNTIAHYEKLESIK